MLLLKFFEKSLKTYFRYLFRYPESKFSGAVGSPPSAFNSSKEPQNALKNSQKPKITSHVAVVKNINNVVVNNSQTQII